MAEFIVTTTSDNNDATDGKLSLREAIALANANPDADTIIFDASLLAEGGVIRLTEGALGISTDITINGDIDGDGKADITISGDALGNDVLLEGTNFTDVENSGGYLGDNTRVFRITDGTTNISSLNITGGRSTNSGGAIDVTANGALVLDKSTLVGNSANNGGAIASDGGSITTTSSTFSGNVATNFGGAINFSGDGNLTMHNTTVAGNSAGQDGGGLFVGDATPDVTLTHVTFTGNEADGDGGGIASFAPDQVSISNSIVLGNSSAGLEDELLNVTADGSNITGAGSELVEDVFEDVEDGAGVLADNDGPVETVALKLSSTNPAVDLVTSTLDQDARGKVRTYDLPDTDNGGDADAGAFELTKIVVDTALDVSDDTDGLTTLREAIAAAEDGATIVFDEDVFANGGLIRLKRTLVLNTDVTIDGDVNGDGKADITISGDKDGDDLKLEGTDFTDGINNTAYSDNVGVFTIGDSYSAVTANLNSLNITGGSASDGGGIAVTDQATLVLDQSNVIGNRASSYGGGIYVVYGTAEISNSVIAHNQASNGGGITNYQGTANITNTTIVSNKAEYDGGGLYDTDGSSSLEHVTITDNFAARGGGIFELNASSVEVTNSIVLGNFAYVSGNNLNRSGIADASNIVGNNGETVEDVFAQTQTSQFGDFQVGVLADNGGAVQTVALKAASSNPAIDLVRSNVTEDARGGDRPIDLDEVDNGGLADAGAHEVSETDIYRLVVNTADDVVDADDGVLSLREAIAMANEAELGMHSISFDREVFADGGVIRLQEGQLVLSGDITINGDVNDDGVADIVISGDKNGDDIPIADTPYTDPFNNPNRGDNSRVFDITEGTVNLESLAITGGSVAGLGVGGGIKLAAGAELTLEQSVLVGNRASKGGGLYTNGGTVNIVDSTVSTNRGAYEGGGLFVYNGVLDVSGSAVTNNKAGYGGGIFVHQSGAEISNTTFYGNNAVTSPSTGLGVGGAIYSSLSSLLLNHVTATGNYAELLGGGISSDSDPASAVTMTNSIVLGNDSGFSDPDYAGFSPDGSNIVSGSVEDIFAQVQDGAGVLADNGGPVETVALKKDLANLALNTVASSLDDDARGQTRPSGSNSDIGAYEIAEGSNGDDILIGSALNDVLFGFAGNDLIYGLDGNDILRGGKGADEMDGGDGNDLAEYRNSDAGVTVYLDGTAGVGGDAQGDTLANIERIFGSAFDDNLTGDDNNNTLSGFDGIDTLNGGGGNDLLIGSVGADQMDGGAGNDLVDYRRSSEAVTVYLDGTAGTGGDAAGDILSNIERVFGSTHDDVLNGDGQNNALVGFDGNDTLNGGDGYDLLIGGVGADQMDGGAGNDLADYRDSTAGVTVYLDGTAGTGGDAEGDILSNIERVFGSVHDDELNGDDNNNRLYGFDGDDTLNGGGGNDLLIGGDGADSMDGGAGNDVVDYRDSTAGVSVDLASGTATGGDAQGDRLLNIERVFGSASGDSLTGDDNSNTLLGFDGDDTLIGGGANDLLRGGDGADVLDGGTGNDVADYRGSIEGVTVYLDGEVGAGGDAEGDILSNIERVFGSAHDDVLTGDDNDNALVGLGGHDSLTGFNGNDTLSGGSGNDSIFEFLGDGSDSIDGGEGTDTVIFEGDSTGYSITDNGGGSWEITDNSTGDLNTLSNIELVQFDDVLLTAP